MEGRHDQAFYLTELKLTVNIPTRRSRFLKVDNRYENLSCGIIPKTLFAEMRIYVCTETKRSLYTLENFLP
jgi:hypothetical protein